jgi:hypothetical protein
MSAVSASMKLRTTSNAKMSSNCCTTQNMSDWHTCCFYFSYSKYDMGWPCWVINGGLRTIIAQIVNLNGWNTHGSVSLEWKHLRLWFVTILSSPLHLSSNRILLKSLNPSLCVRSHWRALSDRLENMAYPPIVKNLKYFCIRTASDWFKFPALLEMCHYSRCCSLNQFPVNRVLRVQNEQYWIHVEIWDVSFSAMPNNNENKIMQLCLLRYFLLQSLLTIYYRTAAAISQSCVNK